MGYNKHDWFIENLFPKLKNFVEEFDKKNEFEIESYNKFIDLLKLSLDSERGTEGFIIDIFKVLIDPFNEDMELDEYLENFFNKLNFYKENQLLNVKYKKGNKTEIFIDYTKFDENE